METPQMEKVVFGLITYGPCKYLGKTLVAFCLFVWGFCLLGGFVWLVCSVLLCFLSP